VRAGAFSWTRSASTKNGMPLRNSRSRARSLARLAAKAATPPGHHLPNGELHARPARARSAPANSNGTPSMARLRYAPAPHARLTARSPSACALGSREQQRHAQHGSPELRSGSPRSANCTLAQRVRARLPPTATARPALRVRRPRPEASPSVMPSLSRAKVKGYLPGSDVTTRRCRSTAHLSPISPAGSHGTGLCRQGTPRPFGARLRLRSAAACVRVHDGARCLATVPPRR
jgi:hypothetical protein